MKELELIRKFYGERCAERSGVPLINHIEEGLDVMYAIGSTKAAAKAFCLHPLFQDDDALKKNAKLVYAETLDPWVMTLVMEYRNQANAWLSDKVWLANFNDGGPPVLQKKGRPSYGPLPEVRHILIADKVQNYKDFLDYHIGSHPRARELSLYFRTWLESLDVSQKQFEFLCSAIDTRKDLK